MSSFARTPAPGRLRVACALVGALVSLAACDASAESAPADHSEGAVSRVGAVSAPTSAAAPVMAPDVRVDFKIDDAASMTVVVTKLRALAPLDYAPSDLVALGGVPGGGDQQMRSEAAEQMTRMYEAALAEGTPFRISSAYRSYGYQQSLYSRYVASSGRAAAEKIVARPGHSEHQTGLTADVYDVEANRLVASFGASAAGLWISAHAHDFGFIVSYPDGKEEITGYAWEPWHVRYVGIGVATAMRNQGVVTLQEFMGVEASPDYG